MPNVATWLNVVRNSSTSLHSRLAPLSPPPFIAGGNFGPGCRAALPSAREETTTRLPLSRLPLDPPPRGGLHGRLYAIGFA